MNFALRRAATLLPLAALAFLAACVTPTWPRDEARIDGAAPSLEGVVPGGELQPEADAYPVLRVVDGDTIKLQRQGSAATVRLLGINSPESVDPRRPVQCFGREASARMKALVEGESIYFAFDPGQEHYDQNGRLLGYVWRQDGRLVNLEMVQGGYANEFTWDDPYLLRGLFRQAAREAERSGRGLWDPATCAGDFAAPAVNFAGKVDLASPLPPALPTGGASDGGPAAGPAAGREPPPGPRIGQIVFDGAEPEEPDEYVEIVNHGAAQNLDGWRLSDSNGRVFDFPDLIMASGQACRVYTNRAAAEHCGLTFGSPGAIWGNSGDRATLTEPSGGVVDEACWGKGCGAEGR